MDKPKIPVISVMLFVAKGTKEEVLVQLCGDKRFGQLERRNKRR
jgi:hypothetical protein